MGCGAMSDLRVLEIQIEDARAAIDRDFVDLATKDLSAGERKAIRDHLKFNIDALRDLKQRRQVAQFPLMPDH
jgi:hypothetical protein